MRLGTFLRERRPARCDAVICRVPGIATQQKTLAAFGYAVRALSWFKTTH